MKKLMWPIAGLVVMTILTGIQEATRDKTIGPEEWVQVILQVVMVINVWATANLPGYTKMKTLVSAVIAVLSLLVSAIIGGIDSQEWINLAITFVAALGVAFTPQPTTKVVNGRVVQPQQQA